MKFLLFTIILNTIIFCTEFDYFYKKKDTLISIIDEYLLDGSIAGLQLAVIKSDSLLLNESFGYSDIIEEKLLNKNNIFRIYSMTKPIVSVGLMILWEKGYFKLEDYVYKYIPSFENMKLYDNQKLVKSKMKIRIIDLLRHTSGLGYGWSGNPLYDLEYNKVWTARTNKEFVELAKNLPLFFEPGENWRYGINTDICGYLIEVLTGESLNEFLLENIFKPLKMTDTHFKISHDKIHRFTSNYSFDNNKQNLKLVDKYNDTKYFNVSFHSGGGGLISTMNDYINFSKMLLNKGTFQDKLLLNETTIEMMTQNQIGDLYYPWGDGMKFGLGFSVVVDQESSLANDTNGTFGWSGAAGTRFLVNPKHELIVIMMIQRMYPYPNIFDKLTDIIHDILKINTKF